MRLIKQMLLGTAACLAAQTDDGSDDTDTVTVGIASNIRNAAIKMAEIANKDDAFGMLVSEALDAGETVRRSPLLVMVRLQKDYGDKLNDFPVPGSKTGNNPDIYSEQVQNAQKQWVKKPGSFYRDFCAGIEEGEAILASILELEKADKTPDLADKELVNLGALGIQQAMQMQRQRFAALVKLVKTAVETHLKINELREEFGDIVKVDYSKEKDKVTPKKATLPLYIQDKEEGTKAKAFAVSAFNLLNVAKAKAKGGDWAAIVSSGGRQGTTPDEGEGNDNEFDVTPTTFDPITAAYASFLDDVDNVRQIYSDLNAKDKEGNYVNDDLLLSIAQIATEFQNIIGKKQYAERLKALKAKQEEANEAA